MITYLAISKLLQCIHFLVLLLTSVV